MRLSLSREKIGSLTFPHPNFAKFQETLRHMSTPIHEPLPTGQAAQGQMRPKRSALRFNLTIALFVWTTWLVFGGRLAIEHLILDWKVALTMVFGSLVG